MATAHFAFLAISAIFRLKILKISPLKNGLFNEFLMSP